MTALHEADSFWNSKETRLGDAKAKELEGKILDNDVYKFEYHSCSKGRQGYSGTAVYSKIKPRAVNYGIGLPEFDHEGRAVTLEFDSFFLVSTYVPNAGEGQKRYQQKFYLNFRLTLLFGTMLKIQARVSLAVESTT